MERSGKFPTAYGAILVFLGTYFITMDDKGRTSMPAKFREVLNSNYTTELIVTHIENYLVAYPRDEWLQLVERARQSQGLNRDGRSFLRLFFARATQCSLDNQGRMLIAPHLRQLAALQRELVLVGNLNRIEVWSNERWEAFVAEYQERYSEVADDLMGESGIAPLGL